jgi:hypothetical protein
LTREMVSLASRRLSNSPVNGSMDIDLPSTPRSWLSPAETTWLMRNNHVVSRINQAGSLVNVTLRGSHEARLYSILWEVHIPRLLQLLSESVTSG